MAETTPCEMRLFLARSDCGQPASMAIPAESGGVIPICDDCIRDSGANRRFLKPLAPPPSPTPETET